MRSETERVATAALEIRAKAMAAHVRMDEARRVSESLRRQTATGPTEPASVAVPSDPTLGAADWSSGAAYVDLPKRLLSTLQIQALLPDGAANPLTATLLGLTENEQTAIQELHAKFQARIDLLEQAHFRRTEDHLPTPEEFGRASRDHPGTRISFEIIPFPEEMDALRIEWRDGLEQILGKTRADFVFASRPPVLDSMAITAQYDPFFRRGADPNALRAERTRIDAAGPSWLTRGTNRFRVTFVLDQKPGETPTSRPFAPGEAGYFVDLSDGNGTLGVRLPLYWRKLITPEMLVGP